MRNILFVLFIACKLTYSQTSPGTEGTQNTANHWNFARIKALDFNSGYPVIASSSNESYGGSTLSDTLGNLLFYVNGKGDVFNKNHTLMENGDLIPSASGFPKQNILVIPVPESAKMYYIFTVGHEYDPFGLYYHKVDMNQNGGLGSVIVKDVRLDAGASAQSRLMAVRHANKKDYWVITRLTFDSCYASFHVSLNGVDPVPVKSPAKYVTPIEIRRGEMKISPDNNKLVSLEYFLSTNSMSLITVSDLNDATGEIFDRFSVHQKIIAPFDEGMPEAAEFSPDSKLLYVGFQSNQELFGNLIDQIWQYDMTMTDSLSFIQSGIHIKTLSNKLFKDIQLAPDGKIYISQVDNVPNGLDSLDVINKPWEKGTNCDYVTNVMGLQTTTNETHGEPFPNFIQEQLYRFVYEGTCAKVPISFHHRFIPEPDSIVWNFGDGITSVDSNPTHVFQSGGNYEVHAHVVYPDGRIEETSREVEVLAAPEPWLGNDTLMCESSTLELDAGTGYTNYSWNGQSLPPGGQFYTVSDSGYYFVRVRNDLNCYGSDTIHVGLYPPVFFDDSGLVISPTTCGNNTGAIRGIQVGQQASIEWRDSNGNLIDTTIDIDSLAVGNYFLTITDTTGCITQTPAYTVNNINSNLIIENVDVGNASCTQANGRIEISTTVLSDLLDYSLDDGGTWYNNNGIFLNVPPGSYYVRVKDREGCEAVFTGNPVNVMDTGGPDVIGKDSIPATGNNADGTITVIATGDSLNYLLNGITLQDTGYFTGLVSGDYTILITDKYGCDTTVHITVGQQSGLSLTATTGNDRKCLKQIATSSVTVSNLYGVKDFIATIVFNDQKITCTNLIEKALPDMTGTLYPGKVVLEWHGSESLTITDTLVLGKLLFETNQAGTADLRWETDSVSTIFTDINGNVISTQLIDSEIEVSNPPTVMTSGDMVQCEKSLIMISAFTFNGIEPFTYEWTKPNHEVETESSFIIFSLKQSDMGDYVIKVTDAYNCIVEDTINITVAPMPDAGFSNDTIPFTDEYRLQATTGYAHYQWSTGDTTTYIDVTAEGKYSVLIKTAEGCADSSSVVMKKRAVIDLKVPNAFTPNGDSLNDIFRPIVNADLIKSFSLVIYNQWGQKIFESYDPISGWTGNNASAGVYGWIITISDLNGKVIKAMGSVILLK